MIEAFIRTAATTAAEDEVDWVYRRMDLGLFRELVRGYLDAVGSHLEDAELNLAFCPPYYLGNWDALSN